MLAINEISFAWRPGEPVIDGLTLPPLDAGQLVCLVGKNGAGKTTLFRLIAGTLPLQQGTIAHGLGRPYLVPQDPASGFGPALSVLGTALARIRLEGRKIGASRCDAEITRSLKAMGYPQLAERTGQAPTSFSGGELQAVALAIAHAAGSRLICLDEPTARVDDEARNGLWLAMASLARSGSLVLVISHDGEMVERHADTIIRLEKGRLAQVTGRGL